MRALAEMKTLGKESESGAKTKRLGARKASRRFESRAWLKFAEKQVWRGFLAL
jgi:hypothetical protein